MTEELQIRVYGDAGLPTLVYLPGLHGDWTLVTGFRMALAGRVRFVEFTYPRSLTSSIDEHVCEIENALISLGIKQGWLIGESFGSQFAWQMIRENLAANELQQNRSPRTCFNVEGLVLAGGFVRYPWKQGPGLLRWIGEKTPMKTYRMELKVYEWYSKFRRHNTPETLASTKEFVERRTLLDRQAMRHRLDLIDGYDPRPVARQMHLPVHYIAGLVDPLVPWPLVRLWLRKNCPGYRGGKTFWMSDHNVLVTCPKAAADLVVEWMKCPGAGSSF